MVQRRHPSQTGMESVGTTPLKKRLQRTLSYPCDQIEDYFEEIVDALGPAGAPPFKRSSGNSFLITFHIS